MPRLHV